MGDILRDLVILYRDALTQTIHSLRRGWVVIMAIYAYALALVVIGSIARNIPLPLVAGLLAGLADACAVGALLALIERAVGSHTVRVRDVAEVVGTYFWDVVAVGFVLWIPLLLVDMVAHTSGHGHIIGPMVSVLAAVFFNPLPEVIYQRRTASPLEALAESVRFVHQHWIEWFLPTMLVVGPLSSLLFFASESVSRAGLTFGHLVSVPALVTQRLGDALGFPPQTTATFVALTAPVVTFALFLFRGHLFAALVGTTSRQRAFRRGLGR
jgi:hypothetical protein